MNPKKPNSSAELLLKIEKLEAEKEKLELELKTREEMMGNLLAHLQNKTR